MHSHVAIAVVTLSSLAAIASAAPVAESAEDGTVRVTVAGGRSFEGKVDALTDQDHLVLRSGSDRAWVRRPIAWQRIEAAEHAGQTLTPDALKTTAENIKSLPAEITDSQRQPAHIVSPPMTYAPQPIAMPPVIAAISFDTVLANWDGDVESDGLIVALQPIDRQGFYAPASGTVEIELFARQHRPSHHTPLSGGRSVEPISRWTCAITPSDFGPSGAVLRFPFGAAHPEFTSGLGSYGLVHVRFSVPGSGVFEDSQDGVRIRPFAPLRDTLQLNIGQRFLPSELTGRGKASFNGPR